MQLTWFGHSAFRLDLAGAVIMIDPFLDNPTFKGDKRAAWKGTTHVIVTHGHDDHVGSAVEIARETGALVVANPEVCTLLEKRGVDRTDHINHGGELDFPGFSVAYVPAWHSSSTTIDGLPVYLGNPGGVVIRAPGERTLLHMGDTGIFDGMGLIDEIYAPKIGIVPIGDRFTMGSKLAALACRRYFHFETVIPCHYGTFGLLHGRLDAFAGEMAGSGAEMLAPERGVPVTV